MGPVSWYQMLVADYQIAPPTTQNQSHYFHYKYGTMLLRNVTNDLPQCSVSHLKRTSYSSTLNTEAVSLDAVTTHNDY
jgi:hypothetical protein